ncbi:unnamed protein product [Soboliphyme baturini]|uniref:Peptidase_M13 domain-containing protein n=1 Tax=Soboliphyme baturini TaxID=241478 RepID=A0A183ISW6_9BILA|nr:unnamed protein product [Soboliphyme baturini]
MISFLVPQKDHALEDTCYTFVISALPFAAGRLYIGNSYPVQKKKLERELVSSVTEQFLVQLKRADWMDAVSKRLATAKLKNMVQNVAYPSWIMSDADLDQFYEGLSESILPDDNFMICLQKINAFDETKAFAKLLLAPDRTDFYASPATVNAWYIPFYNSITIPAAILNPDIFDDDFPMATNYGAAGFVVGHEITHGFDNMGIQFFENGYLDTWMSKQSQRRFANRAQCFIDQYQKFCYPQVNNTCINGQMTLGENLSDNGGLKTAFYAYQRYAAFQDGKHEHIPGFSDYSMNQIFFLSFAHTFCTSISDAMLAKLLLTDVHSPAEARVIGTLKNFEEFGIAFGCKIGQPMRPLKRCSIW